MGWARNADSATHILPNEILISHPNIAVLLSLCSVSKARLPGAGRRCESLASHV